MIYPSFILLALVAPILADCPAKFGQPSCLTKDDVPMGFWGSYTDNDICFKHNVLSFNQYGEYLCFTSITQAPDGTTTGTQGFCECDDPECGCGVSASSSTSSTTTSSTTSSSTTSSSTTSSSTTTSSSSTSACTTEREIYECDNSTNAGNTVCLYCGVSSSCTNFVDVGITNQADRDLIVQKHNELRQSVAAGSEMRGFPGPQPASTNMPDLVWNNSLAIGAQTWAEQCASMAHDTNRNCPGFVRVGQNKADSWSSSYSSDRGYVTKIMGWYDEVADMPASNVGAFDNTVGNNSRPIGHYTQIVWGETTQIGCGYISWTDTRPAFASYPNRQTFVCNYGNGGNVLGQPIYETVPAAL